MFYIFLTNFLKNYEELKCHKLELECHKHELEIIIMKYPA